MTKQIKLEKGVKIKAGTSDGVIYIQYNNDNDVMITQTVLRLIATVDEKDKINDKLLHFLQEL